MNVTTGQHRTQSTRAQSITAVLVVGSAAALGLGCGSAADSGSDARAGSSGVTQSGGSGAVGAAGGIGGQVALGGSVQSGGRSGAGNSNGGVTSSGGATSGSGNGGSGGVDMAATGGTAGASAGGASSAGSAGSAGSIGGAPAGGTTGFPFVPSYIIGADITWTLEQEARGSTYSDAGKVQPIEQIMVNNGFNYIRIRTFVNPSAPGGYSSAGFADTAHTVTWAKRVKACGMGILLDFHMSDTWASIGEQHVPSAWAGMSPADMQKAAHDYVKGALDQMVAAGVKPDMVQIGNETNSAMSGVSISNWANFSGLVNASIKAVRETDPKIIVMAQHGRPRPDGNFEPWVDKYLAGSPPIDEDGICGSTYGTTNNGADWTQEFSYVINKYNKPVWSCEYTDDHRALINGVMRALPKGMGRGSFIWEPTQYGQPLFTTSGSKFVTNDKMAAYPALAKSYNLPVPSGTCH